VPSFIEIEQVGWKVTYHEVNESRSYSRWQQITLSWQSEASEQVVLTTYATSPVGGATCEQRVDTASPFAPQRIIVRTIENSQHNLSIRMAGGVSPNAHAQFKQDFVQFQIRKVGMATDRGVDGRRIGVRFPITSRLALVHNSFPGSNAAGA
jgi:hypothetical protein